MRETQRVAARRLLRINCRDAPRAAKTGDALSQRRTIILIEEASMIQHHRGDPRAPQTHDADPSGGRPAFGFSAAWRLWLCLIVAVLVIPACGGRAQHPETALEAYIGHVRAREPDKIYPMLGERMRDERSIEEFREYFDKNYAEMTAQADALEGALKGGKLQISAALPSNNNKEIDFEYVEGGWFIKQEIPDNVGGGNPDKTLVAFADAIEAQDLGALLVLLSREHRETLEAELNIIQAGLRNVGEDDISISGDIATVTLDWGIRLELRLEGGAWRVHRIIPRR